MATHTPRSRFHASPEPVFEADPSFEVLVNRFHNSSTGSAGPAETSASGVQRQQRVLALAESTVYRIEAGEWSCENFPTAEEEAAETNAKLDDVRAARMLLAWRQLLVRQEDPISCRKRLLPLEQPRQRGAPQRIADKIAFRLKLTIWGGHNFPTINVMADTFGCGTKTLCAALNLLSEQGLIHKVSVPMPGNRGCNRVWRPTDVASQCARDIIPHLEAALRSGEASGILPRKRAMVKICRVGPPVIAAWYAHLEREGLITQGWPQHSKWALWFTTASGVPRGVLPGKTRRLAIAAAIIRRMPEWLARHSDGSWSRILIPNKHALTRDLYADFDTIEQVTSALVELQILERAPIGPQRYFPRPPADLGAAHGVTFPEVKRSGRPWVPAGEPVQWLPLPGTDGGSPRPGQHRLAATSGKPQSRDCLGENG